VRRRPKRDLLASVRELHSVWNSVNILNNHCIKAKLVDLCGITNHEALISVAFRYRERQHDGTDKDEWPDEEDDEW
jgi:hypothetical protein